MKRTILFSLLALVLLLTACGGPDLVYTCIDGSIPPKQEVTANTMYVCPDGQIKADFNKCRFEKRAVISEKDAVIKAEEFVEGYVGANGWSPNEPNVYQDEGHWYAQVIVSKRGEVSFETVVKVDGERGIATCVKNCEYTG